MTKAFYRILLKFFLKLYDFIYQKVGVVAIRYYGFHPKHQFDNFHKFFLDHIPESAKILDIGCSRGELTVDLARKASKVIGYDISQKSIMEAKKNNARQNIYYFVGEAIHDMPKEQFDVVICSNILEHLFDPQEFLRKLLAITERVLIRVPNIENNWIVNIKRDLGMRYFLDSQHNKEYTASSVKEELENAGWQVESIQISQDLRIVAKRKN